MAETERASTPRGSRRRFLLRKLHSLSGVVPVGGFLLFHLWTNAQALWGQARFQSAVGDIQKMPYLPVVELAVVLLPLSFHALYGVVLAFESRPNVGVYPYNRNWMYTAQRASGLVALAFIVWHLSHYWLPKWRGHMDPSEFYAALCADLSATRYDVPWVALGYILGIAASVFHFANGLWGFCTSWGITVSRRSQRTSALVFGVAGLLLFLLGANTAIYFATGSRFAPLGVREGTQASLAKTCDAVAPRVAEVSP